MSKIENNEKKPEEFQVIEVTKFHTFLIVAFIIIFSWKLAPLMDTPTADVDFMPITFTDDENDIQRYMYYSIELNLTQGENYVVQVQAISECGEILATWESYYTPNHYGNEKIIFHKHVPNDTANLKMNIRKKEEPSIS